MGVLRSYEPTTTGNMRGRRNPRTDHLNPNVFTLNEAGAWSDPRYREYERARRRDTFSGFDNPSPAVYQARQDFAVAGWRRMYPERHRDAGDLERATATPVPLDDRDLLEHAASIPVPEDDDNVMNLRRRIAP